MFGCGEETARAVAKEIFVPRLRDKAEGSIAVQREAFVQQVKNLQPRQIIVCRLGDKLRCLKTIDVPNLKVNQEQLENVKIRLLEQSGILMQIKCINYDGSKVSSLPHNETPSFLG